MAQVNRQTLTISKYVRPGTYVGQVYNPQVVNLGLFPRITTFIGRGVPSLLAENLEMVRAFIYRERLTFSANAPFEAALAHPSNGSQLPSGTAAVRLYDVNDQEINHRYWAFTQSSGPSGPYDTIQIFSVDYNPNDTYYIDYQSTNATVHDKLPIVGLRGTQVTGDHRYEGNYTVDVDYQMVTEIGAPVSATTNTGTGVIAIATAANYKAWNRTYTFQVEDSQVVATPTLGATFSLVGTGTGSMTLGTLNNFAGTAPLTFDLTITNKALNAGITTLDIAWTDGTRSGTVVGVSSATPTNVVIVDGIRANLVGMAGMVVASNAVAAHGTLTSTGVAPSDGHTVLIGAKTYTAKTTLTPAEGEVLIGATTDASAFLTNLKAAINHLGTPDTDYKCAAAHPTVSAGTLTATTLVITALTAGTAGNSIATTTPLGATLSWGVAVTTLFGGLEAVAADVFSISSTMVDVTHVQFSWFSDDYQSSSGLLNIYSNATLTGIAIESGILLNFSSITGFVVGDKFTITATNLDSYNWDFTRSINQDFTPGDVYYDALGFVTGVPRSYYITLGHIPVGAVTLTRIDTSAPVTGTPVTGTPYVRLATAPVVNIRAAYAYSNSPQPGQTYYTTVQYTRPTSMYNVPLVYTSYDLAKADIGYPAADNHLAIMVDYAFNVAQDRIVAVIQISDADHDGVYNTADYRVGIEASYRRKDLTDICVLSKFETLADQMYSSQTSNDPLYGALRLFWIGYPQNYTVGTPEDVNTIAYTSKKLLQVYGGSAAHGSFISCANPWVLRTIIQQNGLTQQLTLDGSFFAGMVMSLNNAFNDPNTLLVNQVIPGIDGIATFNDTEVEILGNASNLYALMPDPASPIASIIDAVTTDNSADNYHEINVMVVKQYVTKKVISDANTALIAYVPRNVDDGVSHVRAVIMRSLTTLIGQGIIADYSDSNGRPREIQAADIDVWRDDSDKTRYNFNFWFNGRYGIKRLAGLYSVDANVFQTS